MGFRILAFAALASLFARAAEAAPVTATVTVKATVVKPLTLTALQDLDLGTIILKPGAFSGVIVSISQAGVFSCASANLTCTGSTKVAMYRVVGTNKETVQVTAPNVTLINQSDSSKTLQLVLDKPGAIVLPNSGQPGADFSIGGSLTLNSSAADGTYAGTMNVTVDYQ